MEELKGNLVVTMRFEIPVQSSMYQMVLKDKDVVTSEDILFAEESNYLEDVDSYLDNIRDRVVEVSFDFVSGPRSQRRE